MTLAVESHSYPSMVHFISNFHGTEILNNPMNMKIFPDFDSFETESDEGKNKLVDLGIFSEI